jgi:H+/Cl- antiporter ClcA
MVVWFLPLGTIDEEQRGPMSKEQHESERLLVPRPLIKRRIASGRRAMEQPNVTHDGDTPLTPIFWLAVVCTGVATGLCGIALMWVLAKVEALTYHYHSGSFSTAVASTSSLHRVLSLVGAGILGATLWYFIRKYLRNEHADIDDAIWNDNGELSIRRSTLTSFVSEIIIGMGASVGREAAPKLMGGASGSFLAHRFRLTPAQKRLLVACGGGAGLACVYNVPLGGAIFTAEVLFGSFTMPTVLPALATSLIATYTAWLYLPGGATYADIPNFHFSTSLLIWSVLAGVVIGGLSAGYIRLIGWVSNKRPKGAHLFWTMPLAFALVGVAGIWYPQLFGNGKDIAHATFLGLGSVGVLLALFALKPFATALTIGSGAQGGVFTPFLATGALFGALAGVLWHHVWSGAPVGACAVIGASAMIGASMQAPLTGLVITMELIHGGFGIAIPIMLATLLASYVVRRVDGYSIYSARLPMRPSDLDATD